MPIHPGTYGTMKLKTVGVSSTQGASSRGFCEDILTVRMIY